MILKYNNLFSDFNTLFHEYIDELNALVNAVDAEETDGKEKAILLFRRKRK